jgi:hypothetical protein
MPKRSVGAVIMAHKISATEEELAAYYGPEKFSPPDSENTTLQTVPSSATIAYRSGKTRETQLSFVIERAMLDPDAEVMPYEESQPTSE